MAKSTLRRLRLLSQILFFAVFIGGIMMASHGRWPLPADFFFMLDPIVAIIAMFTSGVLISGLLFSLVVLVLTVFFGRFFCGWICPLGALIDFFEWVAFGRKRRGKSQSKSYQLTLIKFGVLILIVAGSAFSFQFVYFFDPIVIMTRFMGMVMMPVEKALFQRAPFVVPNAVWFLVFTLCILMLSLSAKRFWCRNICPLGALLGLVARLSPSGFVQKDCNECMACRTKCRTGAIMETKPLAAQPQECIRCFDCLDACSSETRTFSLRARTENRPQPERLSRRSFLAWCGGGIVGSAVIAGAAAAMPGKKSLLRPPHSPDEEAFLDLCVRCQACVNSCPTNALQPLMLQSGLYGLWTPTLAPSIGECRVDCSRCCDVCPTHAIGPFDLSTKYDLKIGTAVLSKERCIPHAEGKQCGKCISGCPTAAIGYVEADNLQLPVQIDFLLCVGCGACQKICNEQTWGPPAIVVTAYGRNQPSGVPGNAIRTYLEKTQKDDGSGYDLFK